MNILERLGIDTPQELMLLFLTVALEAVLVVAYFAGTKDNPTIEVEMLFMNPLVGYWLGLQKSGNGNGGHGQQEPRGEGDNT